MSIKQREKEFYGDDEIEATADVSNAIREVDGELEDDSHDDLQAETISVEVSNNMMEKSTYVQNLAQHSVQMQYAQRRGK